MSVWADCYMTLQRVNAKLAYHGKASLELRTGYGKVGLSQFATNNDVSPLMTRRQLLFWLEAFESGMDYATAESEVTP